MKTKSIALFVMLLIASDRGAGAADNVNEALQKGLLEEEANHNLDAAIQAYQTVLNQFDNQRKIAATAVFRLAECYRKLGKTNEAVAQYQRVIQDFSDENSLVGPSERNLATLGREWPSTARGPDAAYAAASEEEAKEIQRLRAVIKNSPDLINAKEAPGGNTPLHTAASKGQLDVARFLLENKAQVNAKNRSGSTPLPLAAEQGHKAMVELLLARGAEVNATDGSLLTPLHVAASRGYHAVAEVLLVHGADLNARDWQGGTPLHSAAETDYAGMVRLLLENKADIDAKDNEGNTPLNNAVSQGKADAAKLLVEKGANVNIPGKFGDTPLHSAIVNSSEELKIILGGKPDLELKNGDDMTPLQMAVYLGNARAVELLLKTGANPNLKYDGPRMLLARNQQEKLQPRSFDGQGKTPLHLAVEHQNRKIVEVLLANGADVNAKDDFGATPLHRAILPGDNGIVEVLLEHQADVNAKDAIGYVPLHSAVSIGSKTIVELLLARGADVNAKNNYAQSPLDLIKSPRSPTGTFPVANVRTVPSVGFSPGTMPFGQASAPKRATPDEIADLLRKHGAKE